MAETDTETTETEETPSDETSYIDYQSVPSSASDCDLVEEEVVEEEQDCPTCTPNPKAPLIDWTKTTDTTPFLNERKCMYSICIRTDYEGTGGNQLQTRLDEYVEEGVIKLLAYYDKALDENTVAAMVSIAGATDHFIPPRPKLKMKALIEIDANEFDKMPSSTDVPEDSTVDEEQQDEVTIPDMSATINIEGGDEKFKKIVHGFEAYARYQAIYYKIQRGKVTFPGGQMVNLLHEAKHLRKVYPAIKRFLRTKGWVLRERRGMSKIGQKPGLKLANKVEFGFDSEYKIISVKVYQHGTCEESPVEYKDMKLYALQGTYPFDRPTTMALLPNLDAMEDDLTRREGMMPWTEFVQTYIYPTPTVNEGVDLTATTTALVAASTGTATDTDLETLTKAAVQYSDENAMAAKTPGSWEDASSDEHYHGGGAMADRDWNPWAEGATDGMTAEEYTTAMTEYYENTVDSKTLDYDEQVAALCNDDFAGWGDEFVDGFMDELFSIWDAIQYQFQNYLCMSPDEREQLLTNLQEMNNQVAAEAFAEYVAVLIGFSEMIESMFEGLDELKDLKDLYPGAMDKIKLCGLFNLLLAFAECLVAGLDFSEMLEPIIAAALSNMDPKSFEKLFVGLPPDRQAAVMAAVEAELGSHVMPWEAYEMQGQPDPAAHTAYGSEPHSGTVVTWGSGGLNTEKAAARQDPSYISPKEISLARKMENILGDDPESGDYFRLIMDLDGDSTWSTLAESFGLQNDLEDVYYAESGFSKLSADGWDSPGSDYNLMVGHINDLIEQANSTGVQYATTVDRSKTITYTATYQDALTEYCDDAFADAFMATDDGEMGMSADEWKADCATSSAAIAYAEAAAEAADAAQAGEATYGSEGPYGTRGSLGAAAGATVTTLLSVYAQQLLEYYVEHGLLEELMDGLNKLPGAEIVAKIIAMFDCVVPPLFDPPLFDFLKTLEIDFCNNQYGIVLPRLQSLPIPNFKDFFKYLLEYAKQILLYILFRLLLYILTKILFMLFDSLCKALSTLGEAASNALADAACNAMSNAGGFLGDVAEEASKDDMEYNPETGLEQPVEGSSFCEDPPRDFLSCIKEAFCGPQATDEQATDTMNQMMSTYGGITEEDAAQMANTEAVNQLVADMSSCLTGAEMTDLLLGRPNPVAQQMIQEVVATENPAFASVLGSTGQVGDLFKNIGDMMPMEFRAKLRDEVSPQSGEEMPANPSLCVTKSDVDRFRQLRQTILTNKEPDDGTGTTGTTPAQADQQFDAMRGRALNDLAEVADLLQGGPESFIANNLPPILGEPDENGCVPPNAILPREPEELMDLLSSSNEKLYDIVGRAFNRDIMGRYGFLNMVLSDTNGVPYTRHHRKARRNIMYSDSYGDAFEIFGIEPTAGDSIEDSDIPFFLKPLLARERGYYPEIVGQYLIDHLNNEEHLGDGYESTTTYVAGSTSTYESPVGTVIKSGDYPRDDKGALMGTEENPFVEEGSKDPDLTLTFKDANKGLNLPMLSDDMQFSEGFKLEYLSYIIEEDEDGVASANTDNVYQLNVVEVTNEAALAPANIAEAQALADQSDHALGDLGTYEGTEDEIYSLTIYGSLSEEAEELRSAYDLTQLDASPQVNLWNQYLIAQYQKLGLDDESAALFNTYAAFYGSGAGNVTHDNIMNTLLGYMGKNIAANTPAFKFGYDASTDDDLDITDKAYMSPEDYEGTPKLFAQWVVEDLVPSLGPDYVRESNGKPRWRKVKKYIKENQIMGTSNHSRLEFLNPSEFGGSWMAPPFYIEPPVYEGWLGIRDALIPEVDGKDPKRVPVCNFEDIKDRVDELTKKMPDDPRLSECPDCVVELPYSRILDRAAASGMEGPILAMIRVYVLEEMLKAMPVFSNFKAVIPEVMDYTYVEYIIAKMKEDFVENLGRKRGFLKGDALWYTFLEQCVQSYARQIQLDGREPSYDVQEAMDKLNALQKDFHYPSEEDLYTAKRKAGENPWESYGVDAEEQDSEIVFGREVTKTTKLAWYRRWALLQAVKDTEEYANVILRSLIEEQLEYMADRLETSLDSIDMKPEITNIYKYFIGSSGMCAGNIEFTPDLESSTGGDVFNVAADLDDNPLNQYAASELDVKFKVVESSSGTSTVDDPISRFSTGEFILEKYIRVYDKEDLGVTEIDLPESVSTRDDKLRGVVNIDEWKTWLESISDELGDSKLSEYFGDLAYIYETDENGDPTGDPTGIEGSMGVAYGLRLSYVPPQDAVNALSGSVLPGLQENASWATWQSEALKEKAFFLAPPQYDYTDLNVTDVTLYNSSDEEMEATTGTTETQDTILDIESGVYPGTYTIREAGFIIPLAYAEYDALDHTISDHINQIEEEMDLTCLANDLIETPEFEMLFQYVFPLNRITSLMSIYVGRAFLMSIGEKVLEMDPKDILNLMSGGFPIPDNAAGEWQAYALRRGQGRWGATYDKWDFDFLFRRTKKRLVRMFRTYFKSREFLSNKDDDNIGGGSHSDGESDRNKTRNRPNKNKGLGSRKMRRRRRDRPYDKNGE